MLGIPCQALVIFTFNSFLHVSIYNSIENTVDDEDHLNFTNAYSKEAIFSRIKL